MTYSTVRSPLPSQRDLTWRSGVHPIVIVLMDVPVLERGRCGHMTSVLIYVTGMLLVPMALAVMMLAVAHYEGKHPSRPRPRLP